MKRKIKKWMFRITFLVIISIVTIVLTILNPGMLYANKTVDGNFTVYHEEALHPDIESQLGNAHELVSASEIYDEEFKIKVCLNDGALYPYLIEKLFGRAFGWGGYNLSVFYGVANYADNYTEINKYKWNLEQLFAHELTHCYQANYFGLFNSNPVADYPTWKWEGYAEYVARKGEDQQDLVKMITRYKKSVGENANAWEVEFVDGTIAPRSYYEYWMLVKYCLDEKGMTYPQLLETAIDRDELFAEMEGWYERELLTL